MEETFATTSDIRSLKEELGNMLTNTIDHLKDWLIETMDQRFNAVDERFDAVDERFNAVDERFDEMGLMIKHGFDAVDQRFDRVEIRLGHLEEQNEIRGQQNRLLAKRITTLELKQPA